MSRKQVMLEFKKMNGKIYRTLSNGIKKYNTDATPIQGRIMFYLEEHKEVTASEILENIKSINKSTLSEILNTMEKNDYIERKEDIVDSRKKIIVLTDKAYEAINYLKKNFEEVENQLLDGISEEEITLFKEIVGKMERNIDKIC